MKKLYLFCLFLMMVFITGCELKKQTLEDATIYTTIYPVEYITNYLYGENSTVSSIYPVGVNLNDYELTEKQLDNYSKGDLFVYVGLSDELDIAKKLIEKNKKMLLIDATRGLTSDNIKELWLAPNNFLMLAKNTKDTLNEYLNNTVKEDIVNKKYDELYKEISWIDAELRDIAKESKENGNNSLVVASNVFQFLEGYGFNVISLEDIEKSKSESAINDIKNKFKNSTYTTIITLKELEETELIKELKDKYKAKTLEINDLITNSDTASDYVTIQNENLTNLKKLLLK